MSSDLTSSSSTTTTHAPIEMTPEQQGVFYELFKGSPIPVWLAQASSEARTGLHASIVASQRSRANAVKAMAVLKNPQQFCTPLLAKAMADKIGEAMDIRGVVFQHIRSTTSFFGLRKKLILPIDRDLLTAACENFEVSETLADNYNVKSLIYQPERINGTANKVLGIEPHEFAQLCRNLDLGKQYQAHLNRVFEPTVATGPVRTACMAHSRRCFDVDRHIALMKKHISAKMFKVLGEVVTNQPSIKLDDYSIAYKGLELLGYKLQGVMLIVAVGDGTYIDNPCVLFMPGDTEQPLKEYPNVRALEVELGERLKKQTFEPFLLRFVALGDRAGLQAALSSRTLRPASQWMQPYQRESVPVTTLAGSADLFADLYRQRAEHVMADARLLVVPTDDEDEKTRLARLDTYKTIGLDIVMFGALFIPVLGEVLMAVSALELLNGVYHGLESWAAGEQEQASDYFFDTVENLVVMAAFSTGAGATRMTFKKVRSAEFVENLWQVKTPKGQMRLWKPDLAPYRLNMQLPAWLKPDERGLRWFEDKAYLALGEDLYAVRPEADSGLWKIEGTGVSERYSPRLETNDAGAWRHDSELPAQWDRLTLFRRLGYSEQDIPDARALQILSVCAIENRVLSRVLIDRTPPPALLIDTVRRFAADQVVIQFIEQLNDASLGAKADPQLQLQLLTRLRNWPAQTEIHVLDDLGQTVNRYASADADGVLKPLKLSLDKVRAGQFYPELLSGLSAAERERLLGSASTVASDQVAALLGKLAEQADLRRASLFDWVYQRGVPAPDARVMPLRKRYPDLPLSVLDELVRYADTSELNQLDADKVPLRLAEEARRFRDVVRVNRAYEGLYLDAVGGIDTDRLVFDALKHLPGWDADIYLQVLEWSFYTEDMATLGVDTAVQQIRMNAHADRYEVRDGESNLLGYLPGRTREHYFQALWEGMSMTRRTALGVQAADRGVALRHKITEQALARRGGAAHVLGIEAMRLGYRSPMRLADTLQSTASSSMPSQPSAPMSRPAALVRRAQELYPTHSLEQIDLFLAGLDPINVLALRKLEGLRLEFASIRQVLQNWISRDTWYQGADGPRLKVTTLAKTRAAEEIIRCWRRETPSMLTLDGRLYELSLPPLQIGELPLITGDFSHVGTLVMDRVGASAGLNSFLHNFKSVRRLSMVGNGLTRLQQAIGGMAHLEILNLSENRIQLTEASVTELASLTRLKHLNLCANPTLTRAPDVSRMQLLERLELRGTGISQWPKGASGLPKLRGLDLRDNRISVIPEDVYSAPGTLNMGTDIAGNPLTPDTVKRLTEFQQITDISLGLIAQGHLEQLQHILMDVSMSSTWLTGATEVDRVLKQALWSAVYAYPDSQPFFLLLARLRYTADFRMVYGSLSQRVWEVVEAAAEDSALRRTLFRLANIGRVSADGYSLLFSNLHTRVLCYRALEVARLYGPTQEIEMTQLVRGLFRLQEVERLALSNIIARNRTEPVTFEQAMEVSLAFRVGLAERLSLPGQPQGVNFSLGVEVIPQTLDWVYAEVVKLEHTPQLLGWMAEQDFWVEYLEMAHRAEFDDTVIRASLAFQHLDSRLHYTRVEFNQSMDAIVSNFSNERTALIRRLTAEALVHSPGLSLVAAVPELAGTPEI